MADPARCGRRHRFEAIEPTDDPHRFRLTVAAGLSGFGAGNHFLMGGVGLGAAIDAVERATERPLVYAAGQFVSFARLDETVSVDVEILAAGRNISQARIRAHVDGRDILLVSAATGGAELEVRRFFASMPDVPGPEACEPAPPRHAEVTSVHDHLEERLAPNLEVTADGRHRKWMRVAGSEITAGYLAFVADFVPGSSRRAIDREGSTNSLDNTIRVHDLVPTDWILLDTHITAVRDGVFHGDARLFAEDGTLLATANQSGIFRLSTPPPPEELP